VAKLACPKCCRTVDFKHARVERGGDDGVEVVTCSACGERFYTERLPPNFKGMWLALLCVSLLAAWLAPRPLREVALVALAILVIAPAVRMLAWGFSS
jgi:hypothetical protein